MPSNLVDPALAAPDRDDDFKLVARDEFDRSVLALGNDLAVAFDGDALAGVAEHADEGGDSQRRIEATRFTINTKFNHHPVP